MKLFFEVGGHYFYDFYDVCRGHVSVVLDFLPDLFSYRAPPKTRRGINFYKNSLIRFLTKS